MKNSQKQIDFLYTLINDQNICERLDPTMKRVKSRINYIKRNYDVTWSGKNYHQRHKNNLLHHHLFELQAAKSSNNKFEIAEAINNYESEQSLI